MASLAPIAASAAVPAAVAAAAVPSLFVPADFTRRVLPSPLPPLLVRLLRDVPNICIAGGYVVQLFVQGLDFTPLSDVDVYVFGPTVSDRRHTALQVYRTLFSIADTVAAGIGTAVYTFSVPGFPRNVQVIRVPSQQAFSVARGFDIDACRALVMHEGASASDPGGPVCYVSNAASLAWSTRIIRTVHPRLAGHGVEFDLRLGKMQMKGFLIHDEVIAQNKYVRLPLPVLCAAMRHGFYLHDPRDSILRTRRLMMDLLGANEVFANYEALAERLLPDAELWSTSYGEDGEEYPSSAVARYHYATRALKLLSAVMLRQAVLDSLLETPDAHPAAQRVAQDSLFRAQRAYAQFENFMHVPSRTLSYTKAVAEHLEQQSTARREMTIAAAAAAQSQGPASAAVVSPPALLQSLTPVLGGSALAVPAGPSPSPEPQGLPLHLHGSTDDDDASIAELASLFPEPPSPLDPTMHLRELVWPLPPLLLQLLRLSPAISIAGPYAVHMVEPYPRLCYTALEDVRVYISGSSRSRRCRLMEQVCKLLMELHPGRSAAGPVASDPSAIVFSIDEFPSNIRVQHVAHRCSTDHARSLSLDAYRACLLYYPPPHDRVLCVASSVALAAWSTHRISHVWMHDDTASERDLRDLRLNIARVRGFGTDLPYTRLDDRLVRPLMARNFALLNPTDSQTRKRELMCMMLGTTEQVYFHWITLYFNLLREILPRRPPRLQHPQQQQQAAVPSRSPLPSEQNPFIF